jgi:hypothetical protein
MSIDPIAAAPASAAAAPPPYVIVSKTVTPIAPPGYTQTQTVKADGDETTVITNATGGTVDTTYSTSTVDSSAPKVNVWA